MKHIKLYEEFVNEASTVEVVYQGPIKKYQDGLFKARKENDGTYTVFITADRQIVDVPYSDVRLVGPKVNEEQRRSVSRAKNLSDFFSISSIGTLNINTGKSKSFNVYDEWSNDVSTVEIYRETSPTQGMIKLVITSGTKPIRNKNGKDPVEGDERRFTQNGRPVFMGNFLGYISLKDLKSTDFFKKLGINSNAFGAYVYK